MMMGHRTRLHGGSEYDALTLLYRHFAWRPGQRKAIKQAHNQRERKKCRRSVERELAMQSS